MTPFRQIDIVRPFYLMIVFLLMSEFLIAQEQCLPVNTVYPNHGRNDKLLTGDFNGDKFNDLVLAPISKEGAIRIMYGSASGLDLKDSLVLNDYYHVSSVGDVQGDGYDDLMISIGNKIYLYKGSSELLTKEDNYTIDLNVLQGLSGTDATGYVEKYADQDKDGKQEIIVTTGLGSYPVDPGGKLYVLQADNSHFGIIKSYAGEDFDTYFNLPPKVLGDMNGDGYVEFGFLRYFGLIEIFYGGNDYFTPQNKHSVNGDFDFQVVFNNVGDVNKDGFDDLLVSINQYEFYQESAWLFTGTNSGFSRDPVWIIKEFNVHSIFDGFGSLSGPAGDVNDDGYADFFIAGGKNTYSLIYFGNADINLIKPEVRFGIVPYQLINGGDINGDLKDDYVSGYNNPETNLSEIGLINGSGTGMSIVSCLISEQPVALNFLAKFGQGAGDVNKDGFDDIVLGHDQLDASDIDEIGRIVVVTGAAVGTGSGGMEYNGGIFNYFGDQFGSGDFNGDGYSDVIAGQYTQKSVIVFYGSANGISKMPDVRLIEDGNGAGWGESIEEVGDLNADGFDDFLSYGKDGMVLLYGSASGPAIFTGWNFRSFNAFRAGDSNKDGFSDFFLQVPEGYRLFYGSATGPVMSSYLSTLPVIFGGDINGDGFKDMLTSDKTNKSIGVLFGNPTGYNEQRNVILNAFSPNGIGDFNGDGFDDIGVSNTLDEEKFSGSTWRVDIYLGSESGINPSIFTTLRSKQKHQNLIAQPRAGDFNKDGVEDLLVSAGYDVWLIYGIKGISNITCPADAIFYADSSCTATVNELNLQGDPALYKYTVTGTSGFEGNGSLNGKLLYTGNYYVTYSLINDNNRFCNFRIVVLDTIPPKISVADRIIVCNKPTSELKIPLLKIMDSCQVKTITYVLTGATSRMGTGMDASGVFNPGETLITWTVTDSSGNTSIIGLKVLVLDGNFNVKIPKAYQINAQQSQANTIYLSYANNTLRLTAYEPNSAKHHYRWTNGDTTRYTYVRHNVPGRYKYSVFVTNDYGCSDRADVFIKVVNNYCKDSGQIYLCYNGSTICVNPAQVPSMISNGARLDKCGVIYESNDLITAKEESNSVGALTLTASPNPSGYEFTLKIDGTKGKTYTLRIINSVGSPVFMKQGITENVISAGASFQKGVYFAEVICGNERRVIKLLKVK
jgi:hypothetical protein